MKERAQEFNQKTKLQLLYSEALLDAVNYSEFKKIVSDRRESENINNIDNFKQYLFKFISQCISNNINLSDVLIKWYHSDDNIFRREKHKQRKNIFLYDVAVQRKRKAKETDSDSIKEISEISGSKVIKYWDGKFSISSTGLVINKDAYKKALELNEQEILNREKEMEILRERCEELGINIYD